MILLETTDLAIRLPEEWEVLDVPAEAELVVAFPERSDGSFRPNVVVTRQASVESLVVASSETIAASLALSPGARVVAVSTVDSKRYPGRLIVSGYDAEATWVAVYHWIFATGVAHVHLTASCDAREAPVAVPHFDRLIANIDFRAAVAL